jgi:transposase
MRGTTISQPSLFVARTVDDFVPKHHALRDMRKLVDEALAALDSKFDEIYADVGRASVAPEKLLRASLLQVLYTIRSERQLVEHIQYNMLYRWFVGLELDDAVWHHATFSKNRDRLLDHEVFTAFFAAVLGMAKKRKLLSGDHFSVDGTLIEAWASHKSFKKKDAQEGDGQDFRGETRSNDTHQSTTDPEAELMRKSGGQESKLRYGVHHLMENRHGLVVGVTTERAAGITEREAAKGLLEEIPGTGRKTVGGDKGYDTKGFVEACRNLNITPHVAQNFERPGGSAIDDRTAGHVGYGISQVKRKLIEATFGWCKQYGGLRRMMFRGLKRVHGVVQFTTAVFNLLRMKNLGM